jgi:DNA-directed RNA polymerase specialized sigma24 family protein
VDHAADFEEFVRARGDALIRFVLSGNCEDAADLVQDALARLGDAWPRAQGCVRTTMAWLHIRSWGRQRREVLVAAVPEHGRLDRYGDADL